jgi:CheY-like chemotaxis protein
VIMDRVLPRLPAEEVAARLKANASTDGIPLFALAVAADVGDKADLFQGFVPQPLDREQLQRTLSTLSGSPGSETGPPSPA